MLSRSGRRAYAWELTVVFTYVAARPHARVVFPLVVLDADAPHRDVGAVHVRAFVHGVITLPSVHDLRLVVRAHQRCVCERVGFNRRLELRESRSRESSFWYRFALI